MMDTRKYFWWEAPLTVADGNCTFCDDGTNGHELYILGGSSAGGGAGGLSVLENQPIGTIVGGFNATDPEGGAVTYRLVNGAGDDNNSLFTLETNGTLKTVAVLDYEDGATLSIRVQARDEYNATIEGNFTIWLSDEFEWGQSPTC